MEATLCDLHVHSSASVGKDEWYTRFFGCPESYAPPIRQYELCKARGMSLVTLTDHDTIAGGLELLDRPDFFLSEEITTAFPENGCVMHVLAWNITPAQHDEIQTRRPDIYRLSEYLDGAGIAHALAHPLLSPSWQLDAETFEKALLLFPALESVNGLTDRRIEPDLATILDRLTPEAIATLVRRHGVPARGRSPHRKALTAGSDDHTHRRCGTIYTAVEGPALAPTPFLERCMAGEGRLHGQQAHLHAMALCVKHTAYHHLKQRQAERADFRNPFIDVMDAIAGRDPKSAADGDAAGFVATLLDAIARASLETGKPLDILDVPSSPTEEDDARVISSIARVSDTVIERGIGELVAGLDGFDIYRMFAALRDVAGGLATALPVFFAADHFGKQELQVRRVWSGWRAFELPPRPERWAVFTDAPDGARPAWSDRAAAAGGEVLIPTCGEGDPAPDSHRVASLATLNLPVAGLARLHVPSPIDLIEWAWKERVTHVELATPGPMGLGGLLVAKILRLPVSRSAASRAADGAAPALLEALAGNAMLQGALRRYLAWFDHVAERGAPVPAVAPVPSLFRRRVG